MYDAIVVGARCAGSSAAMLLARKGCRVLLVDAARFPSDTISTHFIWPPGVACLQRWGLLGRVVATNCPVVRRIGLDLGDFMLSGELPPIDGTADCYAPRRTVLDKLLLDAAAEAGGRGQGGRCRHRPQREQWRGHGDPLPRARWCGDERNRPACRWR